ncbi:Uncharacterized protein cpbgf_600310 [Cryptosporidium parvum]|uniref:Uncharacterized protein n=1 Tax=Cryptosporidium parvum TaxID=5807 RepID=A0A7S7LF09_CRYPV|nr:Uncharacterized protein CPATCC_0011780 [Cryptosporidium parvum]WRK32629.1 Uncharacterized protein cpbgf_600310 [Cryptosporidium parvum]|eukprot:QOY40910.1 hypothetical protein CPATCC_002525 [Cryptosporidium parvum]
MNEIMLEEMTEQNIDNSGELSVSEISGVEYIFFTKNDEANIKFRLDKMSMDDKLLEEYLNDKKKIFMNEKILNIYQGGRVLVGIILKKEYKLCDIIFDLSNSEKQSVLSNFIWEGQYQVLVTKENNYLEIFNDGKEGNNLMNLDDGSYINLIGIYNLKSIECNLYIFQCSIIIKPQYWNDLLNFDILIKYHQNDMFENSILNDEINESCNEIGKNELNYGSPFGDLLVLNEFSDSKIYSYSLSKPIFIKVPIIISNYFLQESSQILFIEILNIGEISDSILIYDIFSHNLKLNGNSPLELPFTLGNNQSLGCSLIRVGGKKFYKSNKNIDEKNENDSFTPIIIPIFIKWKSKQFNSKLILTQFALQINFDQRVDIINSREENQINSINVNKHENSNDHDNINSSSFSSSSSAVSSYLFSPSSPQASVQSICSPFTQEVCYSSKSNLEENSSNCNNNLEVYSNNDSIIQKNENDLEIESNYNFKATCTFDRISKYPGETVYLLIEIFPIERDKSLNLLVTVEYDQYSPIVPLYVSMPINYFPEPNSSSYSQNIYENPTLLYPLKICNPGIYKCPNITIYDFSTKSNYTIKKLPLLVCESQPNCNSSL